MQIAANGARTPPIGPRAREPATTSKAHGEAHRPTGPSDSTYEPPTGSSFVRGADQRLSEGEMT